ncbi:uncharacterized protein LOC120692113 [Panicum virgatum]|uniref:Uncharacterized protein n=1 Tax=Panicum virgatum TaxID=38727 RepID=A0A8T0N665_PANVG|nr:uncharacterized protein LOC120692113 [Panicum virgatum]KAG2543599.1 hypothetical protein PVAP13_9NG761700 [Panicum virgatum]
MGSAAAAPIEISSDEEDGVKMPAATPGKRKSPEGALDWAEKMLAEEDFGALGEDLVDSAAMQEFLDSLIDATGIVVADKESVVDGKNTVRDACGDVDDDCVILDGDPDKPVAVAKEEGPRRDAAEDELQIVAEKGELACRDFPHPRHLCAALPFSTSSHASHCSMCHCYVCDSPAPCAFWGKGTAHTDHCHATDKDAKWKKLRQSSKNKSQPPPKRRSIQNFSHSTTTGLSLQSSVNVNGSTGRLPVSTILAQNQRVDPCIMAPRNMMQGISLLRAPSPRPRATVSSYGSKTARVAPAVLAPSKSNTLQPSVPSYAPTQPAQPHAFQRAQVPPGGRVSAGTSQSYNPQHSGAPIGSQEHRYRPPSYTQVAPNMVVGTGVPLSRYTSVATQGTRYQQVPLADARLKEKEAIASLAREMGVPDYNSNHPLGQQSVSKPQSLHPSQLLALAQAKASQWAQVNKRYVPATSKMRPSSGHNLSNHAPGSTVLPPGSVPVQKPLCQLNSQSSVTPSNLLDGKRSPPCSHH